MASTIEVCDVQNNHRVYEQRVRFAIPVAADVLAAYGCCRHQACDADEVGMSMEA